MKFYHTTDRENAKSIIENGFYGTWGDVGFGLYLFDNLPEAIEYGKVGGWDGSISDFVVFEIDDSSAFVEKVIPDPNWENPEDYEGVYWIEMEEDQVCLLYTSPSPRD